MNDEIIPNDPMSPPLYETVWDLFERIWDNLTKEDIQRLPRDGAAQHDHYIYGLQKKSR